MSLSRILLLTTTVAASALRPSPVGKGRGRGKLTADSETAWESPLLKAVAVPFFAYPAAIVQSRPIIENVFGLSTTTFEDNVREPAAGFLALYSPLGVLEGCLCLALAGAVAGQASTHSKVFCVPAVVFRCGYVFEY